MVSSLVTVEEQPRLWAEDGEEEAGRKGGSSGSHTGLGTWSRG